VVFAELWKRKGGGEKTHMEWKKHQQKKRGCQRDKAANGMRRRGEGKAQLGQKSLWTG
jgi:hypothetical protein